MTAIAQFTIYSLNDVIASTTAPESPYKGQLWVNTSYSPPRTYVYNGSAWKEQNGTDTLRTNVSTLTTKASNLETNLNGLTSEVSAVTTRVTTTETELGEVQTEVEELSSDVSTLQQTATSIQASVTTNKNNISSLTVSVNGLTTRVTTAEGNISSLTQRATSLEAEVSGKVDETYGDSTSTFGWVLKSTGFYVYSNATTVVSITSSALTVKGTIYATAGEMQNMTITGYLRFGGNTSYYISANYNDSNWYLSLPGLRIDNASKAVFSGRLSAPTGTIGGFTITTTAIYKSKTAYNDANEGVYIGTTGIGLGAGTFYVTSAGKLYATDAEISGTITATSGTIGGFTIGETSLTNSTGGSKIEITSGNYTTRFSSNAVSASYSSSSGWAGWSLNLNGFSIAKNVSSTYPGIDILPSYTKRSSYTGTGSTTVAEACITSNFIGSYNVDTGYTSTSVPFIIGIPREYQDPPYAGANEWGSFARFVDYLKAELVYDSYYGSKWYLRNAYTGTSYDIVDAITHVSGHKFYFWKYTSSVTADAAPSCTKSTHGLSTVSGAIVVPRATATSTSGLSGYANVTTGTNRYGVTISGTTVYVAFDDGTFKNGFFA